MGNVFAAGGRSSTELIWASTHPSFNSNDCSCAKSSKIDSASTRNGEGGDEERRKHRQMEGRESQIKVARQ